MLVEFLHRIADNGAMARNAKSALNKTGLYYAREARGMSRTELVKRSGVSKQQLSRLENGLIRLRLDHLKPFANSLGYSPEQILLWGRYPGIGGDQIQGEVLHQAKKSPNSLGVQSPTIQGSGSEEKVATSTESNRKVGCFRRASLASSYRLQWALSHFQ